MNHWHHIVPKHAGGTDDPSNLVLLSVEEHAVEHKRLWEQYGRWQDKIAWKTLSGQISIQEARQEMMKHSNPMHDSNVLEKMSGVNHWSKRENNKDKKLFGDINPMNLPGVKEKMSGVNHWSKRPGKVHNAITNHPKGSSKRICVSGITYNSIKEASETLGISKRRLIKMGTII